ncbi:hypothetical protein CDO44_13770 [Pigmentiphaga sp. NML080357]|uniref:DUF192 domain-containing protein n=1 Tax=Pigmentiphaga sp. NML080357 TaxID=2008675 RepID=UPI000B4210EA|nr:DUF192 domain-containing protein [Pigmentiphaga sp. NML080357]OVZ58769.1 hypothetical protein CDO44_13770 [Pigmentiphaga sp. NML080357]
MTRFFSRLPRLATCAGAGIAAWCLAGAVSAQASLPMQTLRAGMHLIHAEVASTPQTREKGLMFREQLGANQGMLFIFEVPGTQCMWMRNTLVPLSVAFIADDGTIANIEDMAPKTEDSHCAVRPVRYALEMERGWFAKRGLKAGSRIDGIPGAR